MKLILSFLYIIGLMGCALPFLDQILLAIPSIGLFKALVIGSPVLAIVAGLLLLRCIGSNPILRILVLAGVSVGLAVAAFWIFIVLFVPPAVPIL